MRVTLRNRTILMLYSVNSKIAAYMQSPPKKCHFLYTNHQMGFLTRIAYDSRPQSNRVDLLYLNEQAYWGETRLGSAVCCGRRLHVCSYFTFNKIKLQGELITEFDSPLLIFLHWSTGRVQKAAPGWSVKVKRYWIGVVPWI